MYMYMYGFIMCIYIYHISYIILCMGTSDALYVGVHAYVQRCRTYVVSETADSRCQWAYPLAN